MRIVSRNFFPILKQARLNISKSQYSILNETPVSDTAAEISKGSAHTNTNSTLQQGISQIESKVGATNTLSKLLSETDKQAEPAPFNNKAHRFDFNSRITSKYGSQAGNFGSIPKYSGSTLSRYNKKLSENLNPEDQTESSHILHVNATSNNTLLSLTNYQGRIIMNMSCGMVGFKKSKRSGYEAAYQTTTKLIEKVNEKGIQIRALEIRFKGLGQGRDSCFKAIRSITDWRISRLSDVTPIPFNGCRPKKARRL
ncbi:hypothetical protein BB561_005794 [Smittium simulii]|uniref:Ribosomal protein S11 n=1 Tax=Smittium simulii TaxID=133385 RepID=A0A2T9Y890_9FUNG|nr:hypothetical protein BB561_005794 [Smittium simulii]